MKAKGAANANAASNKPDTYAKALVAEEVLHIDDMPTTSNSKSKHWLIDTGCTSHFCLNISEFASYTPYTTCWGVRLSDSRHIPSLGEGTVRLTCLVGEKMVT